MKHILKFFLILAIPAILYCHNTIMPMQNAQNGKITLQNKPIARAADEIITVLDVKRKMDLFLQEHYPNILSDTNAKLQYYTRFYAQSLDDLIMQKLMVVEALDREIKISDPDIHEEMHKRFGSNPVQKITSMNLSFDDCKKQIKEEIIVQNMLYLNATMQALSSATPKATVCAYNAFLKENPAKDNWSYQVMTIKADDTKSAQDAANKTKALLGELKSTHLGDIISLANDDKLLKDVHMNVSKTFTANTSQLSTEHKSVLLNLKENSFSEPILQHSRATNSEVFRIFHLMEYKEPTSITLKEKSNELKNMLINNKFEELKDTYYSKLKTRYQVEIFEQYKNLNPFSIG